MKKVALIFIAIGATIALTTPAFAQAPGGAGRAPGRQGGGNMADRMARMLKARETVYSKLGLSAKQKKSIAKLDKHVDDEQKALFATMGGPGGRPGGGAPGGPPAGARAGGPPTRGGGGGGMRAKFMAMRTEREDGLKKILSKAQFEKYSVEWAKAMPPRRGRGGPGGPGGGRPGAAR